MRQLMTKEYMSSLGELKFSEFINTSAAELADRPLPGGAH